MEHTRQIEAGRILLEQFTPETIELVHRGKLGQVRLVIDAAKVERWALRILREEAFSDADMGDQL